MQVIVLPSGVYFAVVNEEVWGHPLISLLLVIGETFLLGFEWTNAEATKVLIACMCKVILGQFSYASGQTVALTKDTLLIKLVMVIFYVKGLSAHRALISVAHHDYVCGLYSHLVLLNMLSGKLNFRPLPVYS